MLSDEQVHDIRHNPRGLTWGELKRRHGVSRDTLWKVKTYQRYRYLP